MEHEFEKFDLKLDEPVGHTHRTVDKTSWYSKFLCAPRDKRVCWQTRVEHPGQNYSMVTLDEQAENLMDAVSINNFYRSSIKMFPSRQNASWNGLIPLELWRVT